MIFGYKAPLAKALLCSGLEGSGMDGWVLGLSRWVSLLGVTQWLLVKLDLLSNSQNHKGLFCLQTGRKYVLVFYKVRFNPL